MSYNNQQYGRGEGYEGRSNEGYGNQNYNQNQSQNQGGYGGGGGYGTGSSNEYYDNNSNRNQHQNQYGDQGYNNQQGQGQSYGQSQGQGQGSYGSGGYNTEVNSQTPTSHAGYNAQFSSSSASASNYNSNTNTNPSPYNSTDLSSAVNHASEHHSSEDKSLFSTALSFLTKDDKNTSNTDLDEQQVVNAHQAMYGSGSSSSQKHDSSTVGAGAAIEALKMFTSGGKDDGGMDKNKLIGLAMAQAGKLWDEKNGNGGNVSGDKQSAINSAAEVALKMYLKSQGVGLGALGVVLVGFWGLL
ncbi:hypothetical protein N7535_008111 [Penicillium sp. DV-2018c]|nr:hypothetical protein N7535_008111 [Penicillium sp. DV-2018c]